MLTKYLQKTCFTDHVNYSWIFLDARGIFLSHSPLRSGDRSAPSLKSHLTKRMVYSSKTLAIFGQYWACTRLSNFNPLIQGFFSVQ